jgi:hypothetical protein
MPRTLLGDEIIESLSSVAAYREVVGTVTPQPLF